jgi:hypothetical protein
MWVITEDDKTLWEDGQVNESNTECMMYENVNSFKMIDITANNNSKSRRF